MEPATRGVSSMFVSSGAPWWFLDTPHAMERYRRAITDSAGFAKTSDFIDDTRASRQDPAFSAHGTHSSADGLASRRPSGIGLPQDAQMP